MILPLEIQFNILIVSIIAGIFIGVLFDLYRVIRGINHSNILVAIQDILFWILSGLIVFIFILVFNFGFLTTYVYLLISVGLILYFSVLSKKIFRIENFIGKIFYTIIRIFNKQVRYIFKNIFSK
ncbi:MAG: spore cortex biosynthesis protein YabQ [Sarcina sp.]